VAREQRVRIFPASENKKTRFAGRRSAKRVDLKNAAVGRRSATLWVQSLGGGVKLNNRKLRRTVAAFKK